jgi:hypothetical protein
MIEPNVPGGDPQAPDANAATDQHADGTAKPLPFDMEDEDLLVWLSANFKEAYEALKQTRIKRERDWKFYAGDQWEEKDRLVGEKQKRPTLTLNMILSIIAAVEGEERTNRQEMKFYGETQGADGSAFAFDRIVKWIMHQCGGEFSLSQMFRSGIVCGEGWVVPEVDYFDDPNGLIKLVQVDDKEMFPDPLDTDPTCKGRYLNRMREMTIEEIEARWPGSKDKLTQRSMMTNTGPESDGKGFRDIYSTPNDTTSVKLYDARRKLWSVIETWWPQIEPGYVMVDEQTGMLVEKSASEFEGLKAQREQEQAAWMQARVASVLSGGMASPGPLPGLPGGMGGAPDPGPRPPALQAKARPIRRFYQAFWSAGVILDKVPSPLPRMKRFPYVSFRGMWDKVGADWFGIVRSILDPQRQHNVEQSIIVQLMQLMPKASWMAPKGAYHDRTKWENGIAQPGSLLEYNATRGKPEQISTPSVSRDLINMAQARPASMREISGVNVDLMGQRQAGDPGVVMEMRQKAAKTVLATFFDNYREAKIVLGKILVHYIQAYISVGRRIRVLGSDGQQFVQMTEDMTVADYDLTVEETNSTVNDRMATLTIMQTTLPNMIEAGVPIPASFVDLLPMPPNIRDDWKRQLQWMQAKNGDLPPPGWQPGMPPAAFLPPPPGAPPAGAPPGAAPAPQPPAAPAPPPAQ